MPYTDNMPYLTGMTELVDCLKILYEILNDLEDIRIALEKGRLLSFPQPRLRSFQNYQKILLMMPPSSTSNSPSPLSASELSELLPDVNM
jgi:hypothetical protein